MLFFYEYLNHQNINFQTTQLAIALKLLRPGDGLVSTKLSKSGEKPTGNNFQDSCASRTRQTPPNVR